MADVPLGRWERIRAETLTDPRRRARYERQKRVLTGTRRLLQTIEAERERIGLSKADVAERIGTNPSVVRRLLTSATSNPTLQTILNLLDAVGLDLVVQPRVPTSNGALEQGEVSRPAGNAAASHHG